jgi:hypothetical protein
MKFHHLFFILALTALALGAPSPRGGGRGGGKGGGKGGSPFDGGVSSAANQPLVGDVVATFLFVVGLFAGLRLLQL